MSAPLQPSCAMLPLAEARRDGRLQSRESESVERHVRVCAQCRSLVADIGAIGELGRRLGEQGAPSALEHRRRRLALLRAAAAPPVARRSRRAAVALTAAAAVALTVALTVFVRTSAKAELEAARSWGLEPGARQGPIAAAVTPSPSARFERRQQQTAAGSVERVQLFDGAIDLQVASLGERQRFLVVTRDAEVEVRGTRFRVAAEDGALRLVVVRQGRVEVRHAGSVRLLEPGDSWSREAPVAGVGTEAAELPAVAARETAAQVASVGAPLPEQAEASSASATAEPIEPPSGMEAPRSAALDPRAGEFARAVHALEEGDYRQAGQALETFARQHPSDERAEDAHFLRIVALQRQGRHAAAAQAARAYLSLYPAGARRVEAEAIARRSSEAP